jgi:hypothetical protein
MAALKPRIQLKVIDKEQFIEETEAEALEKKKGKRGRPRKTPLESEIVEVETEHVPLTAISEENIHLKKRGRKKKKDTVYSLNETSKSQAISQLAFTTVKNYIVQLNVKSSDLEKIQKQFINKTHDIGYRPLVPQKSLDNGENQGFAASVSLTPTTVPNISNTSNANFDEYYKLLNNLEMPLIPVADLSHKKLNMICGKTLRTEIPEIPNVYQTIVMPVLPENVPIHLFDESETDYNSNQFDQWGRKVGGDDNFKAIKNTTNLMLPQFGLNGKQWPEKSPYACWNCDIFFDGTPIGCPEKEVEGYFYCYGNFCSFGCVARYLKDREDSIDYWKKYSLLCIIYQKAYNLPAGSKVALSPQRETLTKYGGKLSYEEYHLTNQLHKIIEIYKLPLIPVMLHIEEISRSTNINNIIKNNTKNLQQQQQQHQNIKSTIKTKKATRFIPIDPQKLIKAEENVKQKHQERLQSTYTLDDCLGHR